MRASSHHLLQSLKALTSVTVDQAQLLCCLIQVLFDCLGLLVVTLALTIQLMQHSRPSGARIVCATDGEEAHGGYG